VEPIVEIFLQVVEIFILILGVTGLILSLLLVISPNLVKSLSRLLDRKITFEKNIIYLNQPIETDSLTYRHHIIFGMALIAGSVFVLMFLFLQLDVIRVVNIFEARDYAFLVEIIIRVLAMVGKIAGILGIVFGFILMLAPGTMIRIENRMDSWFPTDFVVDKLDEFHPGIEDIILKYPLFFGFTGLMTSGVLILLSIVSMLS